MERAEKEAEVYRIEKTAPVFMERRKLTRNIPKFWYIVLAQHEEFTDSISTDDLKFLEFIKDIHVVHMVDPLEGQCKDPRKFSISFEWESPANEVPNQTVTKYFRTVFDDKTEEKIISQDCPIEWPSELDAINPGKISDLSTKASKQNYRTGMKSFFAWFRWTGEKPGKEFREGESIARMLAEDIFPHAVKYFAEAMPGVGEDSEGSSSEELDLSEDEPERKKQKSS